MLSWKKNTYDSTEFHSFRAVEFAHDYLRTIACYVWFFLFLRFFSLALNATTHTATFYRAVVIVVKNLFVFLILGSFIAFVFGYLGWILFHSELLFFRDLRMSTFNMIHSMCWGLPEEVFNAGKAGPVFGALWYVAQLLVFTNVIIAILVEVWEEVSEEKRLVKTSLGLWATWIQVRDTIGFGRCFRQIKNNYCTSCCAGFDWCLGKMKYMICWCFCAKNKEEHDPNDDFGKEGNLTKVTYNMISGLDNWKKAYPCGCPYDKLKYFVDTQTLVDERFDPEYMLMDSKGGPVLPWDSLINKLKDLQGLQNKNLMHKLRSRRENSFRSSPKYNSSFPPEAYNSRENQFRTASNLIPPQMKQNTSNYSVGGTPFV